MPNPRFNSDDAAMYVAGGLTSEEMSAFEQQLESDPALRASVVELNSVAEFLADQVEPVEPSSDIRRALMEKISTDQASEIKPSAGDLPEGLTIIRDGQGEWEDAGIPGVFRKILNKDFENRRLTLLFKLDPGAVYPAHAHEQYEECFMIHGDLDFGNYQLKSGDYLNMAAGTQHTPARSVNGCVCVITSAMPDSMVA